MSIIQKPNEYIDSLAIDVSYIMLMHMGEWHQVQEIPTIFSLLYSYFNSQQHVRGFKKIKNLRL